MFAFYSVLDECDVGSNGMAKIVFVCGLLRRWPLSKRSGPIMRSNLSFNVCVFVFCIRLSTEVKCFIVGENGTRMALSVRI